MRLLVVTSSFPRHAHDHAGRFVLDLSLGLSAAGETVEHIAPWEDGCSEKETLEGGVAVRRFRYGSRWLPESLAYGDGLGANLQRSPIRRVLQLPAFLRGMRRAVTQRLREETFDCVLSHWLIPGAWASTRVSIPHMAICHGGDIHALSRWPMGARLLASITRRTQHVFFVSEDLRRRAGSLLAARGVPMPNCSVVPMGVDASAFGSAVGVADNAGEKIILAVGRLVHLKGFDTLIQAASTLCGARVVVVGDGPERASLEQLARSLNAAVEFRGHQSPSALPSHYAEADIVCIPSRVGPRGRAEGHPMVLAEAMTTGTCVVASRSGGLTAALEGTGGGVLFEPDDVDGLAAILQDLIDDGIKLRRISEEARSRGPEFDRARTAESVRKVGYTLING